MRDRARRPRSGGWVAALALVLAVAGSLALYAAWRPVSGVQALGWLALAGALGIASLQRLVPPLVAICSLRAAGQVSGFSDQLRITLLASLTNSLLPLPAGIPVRAALMHRLLGVTLPRAVASLAVENLAAYAFAALAALVAAAAFLGPGLEWHAGRGAWWGWGLGGLAAAAALACLWLWRRGGRPRAWLQETLGELRRMRPLPLLVMLGVFLLDYGLALLRLVLVLIGLGLSLPLGPLFACQALAYLAGVVSMVPMGLGVRDAGLASLLVWLGLPWEAAGLAVALERLVSTAPLVLGGALAAWSTGRRLAGAGPQAGAQPGEG